MLKLTSVVALMQPLIDINLVFPKIPFVTIKKFTYSFFMNSSLLGNKIKIVSDFCSQFVLNLYFSN